MFRKIVFIGAVIGGCAVLPAAAAIQKHGDLAENAVASDDGLRLAQYGDVEIYYDTRGRRVIVDAWSGEVIAIEPPRRANPPAVRRAQRERELRRDDGRYYLDDPEDMARLRRLKRREYGEEPLYEEFEEEPRYAPETFPAAPRDVLRRPRAQQPEIEQEELPPTIKRLPVERKPLREAMIDPIDPEQPEEIVVEPERPSIEPPTSLGARPEVAALQILLDRAGASPGVIDGRFGSNVDKALVAYRDLTGQVLRSTDAEGIKAALAASGGDAFTTYTITASDAAGPYVASVPADYGEKAKLEKLSYTSTAEMLAERFHMDEGYLKALNPGANFGRPGTVIKVANTGANRSGAVQRIVADKGRKQLRAYDAGGKLVAAYPATIGSSDTPSPTGKHTVARIAFDPVYTYNPKLNFKQGANDKVLTIPPGPNGPVGSIWIALSKPTYGIHGTPEPSKIGKTESHGCVRLTNWDAQELARMVKQGVSVEFVE